MISDPLAMIPDPRQQAWPHPRAGLGGPPLSVSRPRRAWRAAQEEAALAYAGWCRHLGRESYVVYRAAQDRADRAQEVLAAGSIARVD
jgi:hypothetical protein